MTLFEYKKKHKLSNVKMAKLFEVSPPTICHWLSGYSKPSLKRAADIFIKTKGQVKMGAYNQL